MISQKESIDNVFNFNDQTQKLENFRAVVNKKKSLRKKKNGKQVNTKAFYFKLGVLRKVATFLQNLKNSVVRSQPFLRQQQKTYLQNECEYEEEDSLIRYDNKLKLFFDLIMALVSIIIIWKNSFQLALDTIVDSFYALESIVLLLSFIDIGLFYNSEYKNQKLQIVSNRKVILEHYVNDKLKFDFFVILGLLLQIFGLSSYKTTFYISRIMVLLIIVTFLQKTQKFENIYVNSTKMQSLFSIINLLGLIIGFIHCLALLFNIMSRIEKEYGIHTTWIQHNQLTYNNKFQLYIFSWYWGSTIMSTVGFGDIVPANVYQRAIISFVEVLCCVSFGYFVNYIGSLIGVLRESKQSYDKDIRRLNKYVEPLPVSDRLKNNLRTHFYNSYKTQQIYSPSEQKEIFTKLPVNLKENLVQACNFIYLTKSKLASVFSDSLLKRLSLKLKKVVYAPQEIIFHPNKQDIKLWILVEGQISQLPYHNPPNNEGSNSLLSSKIIMKYSSERQRLNTLSWINFISGRQYHTIGRADKFTIAYELQRSDFLEVIQDFKDLNEDKLKFNEIKEIMINSAQYFVKECLACDRFTHNVAECSKLHFKPKKIQNFYINKKTLKSNTQKRKHNILRKNKKYNWKANFSQLTQNLPQFLVKSHNDVSIVFDSLKSIAHKKRKITRARQTVRPRQTSFFERCSVDGFMSNILKLYPENIDTIVDNEKQSEVQKSRIIQAIITEKQYVKNNFDLCFESSNEKYFPDNNEKRVIKLYNQLYHHHFQKHGTRAVFGSSHEKVLSK